MSIPPMGADTVALSLTVKHMLESYFPPTWKEEAGFSECPHQPLTLFSDHRFGRWPNRSSKLGVRGGR